MRRYLPLVLTMVFWASAFTCSKLAVGTVPPELAAALRFGGGGLVLLTVLAFTERGPRFGVRGWSLTGLLGLLGVFGYNMLFFQGLVFAPATDGGVIVPVIAPVLTAVGAAVLERAMPEPRRLLGLGIALGGAVVFFVGIPASGGSNRLLGDVFFMAAAVPWAAYTLVGRTVLRRYPALPVTAYATLGGALLLALAAVPTLGGVHWSGLGVGFWLNMAYLAVFPTAVAYPLYYRGVRQVGPARTSAMMFLVPVFGLVIAYVFLYETIGPVQGAGSAVMLVGAWLATAQRSRSAQQGKSAPDSGLQASRQV